MAPNARTWNTPDDEYYSNNQIDPKLQEANRFACEARNIPDSLNAAELTEPLVIRELLTQSQIDEILTKASAEGTWPRGIKAKEGLSKELEPLPHHYAWTGEHAVLYMHNNDHWFVRALPDLWALIRGSMESVRSEFEGVAVQDDGWIGCEQSMVDVRTVELHHYARGGGLLTAGHKDTGSELTISVLLSNPADYSGGDFVTYTENDVNGQVVPVAHKLQQGDAILFHSEKLHNVSTIHSGVRQSLVVELWPSKRY